jgi:hypothetical protein
MAEDPQANNDSEEREDKAPRTDTTVGAPRWVKVSGVIGLVVVLVFVLVLVVGGGNHGPGRHSDGDPPPGMTDHSRPEGGHGP